MALEEVFLLMLLLLETLLVLVRSLLLLDFLEGSELEDLINLQVFLEGSELEDLKIYLLSGLCGGTTSFMSNP